MKKQLLLIASMLTSLFSTHAQSPWVMQNSGFMRPASYPFCMSIADANTAWCGAYTGDGSGEGTQEFTMTTNGDYYGLRIQ